MILRTRNPGRQLRAALPLFLALGTLAGCRPPNHVRVEERSALGRLPGVDVQAGRAFPGHPGARTRGFHVVRTRAEWEALWPEPRSAPPIDFSREMALAAFAGEKTSLGHALLLNQITREGDTLHVALEEHLPAPGCPLPPGPSYPALLIAVPRHLGEVHFAVRRRQASACLSPPALALDCRVEHPDAPYQNHGRAPHPRVGQSVMCAATAEPGARLDFELLAAPEGARAALEHLDGGRVRLPIRAEGLFRLGAQAIRADGLAARLRLDFEAGIPTYAVELTEEEPEGARGLSLSAWRRGAGMPPSSSGERCAGELALAWCSPSSDGYTARLSVPADTAGQIELWVERQPSDAAPQARLKVRLGQHILFDEALPDGLDAWGSGQRLIATLSPAEARAWAGSGAAVAAAKASEGHGSAR